MPTPFSWWNPLKYLWSQHKRSKSIRKHFLFQSRKQSVGLYTNIQIHAKSGYSLCYNLDYASARYVACNGAILIWIIVNSIFDVVFAVYLMEAEKPLYLYNHQKQKLLIGYYQFPSGLVNFFLPYIRRKSAKILSGFCLARKRGPLSRDATGKAFIAILQRLVCMTWTLICCAIHLLPHACNLAVMLKR